MKSNKKQLGLLTGAAVTLGVSATFGALDAHAKGFSVLGSAAQVRSALISGQSAIVDGQFAADTSGSGKTGGEGKCGEGKCGENKDHKKNGEGKCGEGKCGENKDHKKSGEGKCGEGKCGK